MRDEICYTKMTAGTVQIDGWPRGWSEWMDGCMNDRMEGDGVLFDLLIGG